MEENTENKEWMKAAWLKAGAGNSGFTTPPDYFEQLKDSINAEIAAEQIKAVIPNDGYDVPPGYFEQLQANILAKTTAVKEPKIVKLWHSKVVKYASAACFLIIASAGLYFNQHHPVKQVSMADTATEQMLYDIDEQVIIDHVQNNNPKPETTVGDAALETYILSNYSQNELAGNL